MYWTNIINIDNLLTFSGWRTQMSKWEAADFLLKNIQIMSEWAHVRTQQKIIWRRGHVDDVSNQSKTKKRLHISPEAVPYT